MSNKLTDQWTKSTESGNHDCVEARTIGGLVEVRNSKYPAAGSVRFTIKEWNAFVEGVAAGEMRA